MTTALKNNLLIAGAAAGVLYCIHRKKAAGVGAVDNEWGANEMFLWVMNTESLYNKYRNLSTRMMGDTYYKDAIRLISRYLMKDIHRGNIPLESGMGRGEKARMKAAEDIYNAFHWDWMQQQVKQ